MYAGDGIQYVHVKGLGYLPVWGQDNVQILAPQGPEADAPDYDESDIQSKIEPPLTAVGTHAKAGLALTRVEAAFRTTPSATGEYGQAHMSQA